MDKKLAEIQLEIEFYKEIAAKIFTADLLVAGGTVTLLQTKGLIFWSAVGLLLTHLLTISFVIFLKMWRDKIEEFKEANRNG